MASRKNPFLGKWRITEMEQWDLEFIDAEEEGYIEFDKAGQGDFQFGYVHGSLDCEIGTVEGRPRIEFSWDGNNELDPANCRGWAVLEDNGTMHGKITFHMGENSWFKAGRKTASV
jgi:hypothetical protein